MTTDASELAEATSSKDPRVGLTAVAALRSLLESLEELQVENAREQGWTWNFRPSLTGGATFWRGWPRRAESSRRDRFHDTSAPTEIRSGIG